MPYTINKTSGNKIAVVQDGTTDSTTLPITLLGRNFAGYGEPVNENFVKILENFANRLPPSNAMTGQFWYDTNAKAVKLNVGVNTSNWKSLGFLEQSSTQPIGHSPGDMWYKPDSGQLYAYSGVGTTWNLIGPIDTKAADNGAFSDTVLNFNTGLSESVVKLRVKGIETGIISSTKFTVRPDDVSYAGFHQLVRGINLPSTSLSGVSYNPASDVGYVFWGTAGTAMGVVKSDGTYVSADNLATRASVMAFDSLNLGDDGILMGTHSIFKIHVTDTNTGNLTVLDSPNPAKLNINIGSTSNNVISIFSTTNQGYVFSPATGINLFMGTSTNKIAYVSANVVDASAVYDNGSRALTSISIGNGNVGGVVSINGSSATISLNNLGTTSVAGTANQVLVNGATTTATGAVTLSLPQNIDTNATVTFNRVNGTQLYDSGARVITTSTLNSQLSGYVTTYAMNNALSSYVPNSKIGVPNGVAGLDPYGIVMGLPSATTSTAGVVKLVDNLTTLSSASALTANMGAYLASTKMDKTAAYGANQSWQDMTASRAYNVTYTNSTGKPITVMVFCQQNQYNDYQGDVLLAVDGVVLVRQTSSAGYQHSQIEYATVTVIVPPGSTYYAASNGGGAWISGGMTITRWSEYR